MKITSEPGFKKIYKKVKKHPKLNKERKVDDRLAKNRAEINGREETAETERKK